MLEKIGAFLTQIGSDEPILSGVVALFALAGIVLWPVRWAIRYVRPPAPPMVTVANLAAIRTESPSAPPPNTIQMQLETFTALQAKQRDEARADLAKAHGAERQRLEDKIEELNRRYANPEVAFAQFQATINELEVQLTRRGNDIGGDRTNDAKAALERGDFTLAKSLFEEISARAQPEIMTSAEANYALGQIAESEIRWHDAATHYQRSASLVPSYLALSKAQEFVHRSGYYNEAERLGRILIVAARSEDNPIALPQALNSQAITLRALGRFPEAEAIYLEALEISSKTIGTADPVYSTILKNLALLLHQNQGRFSEAEALLHQARDIDAKTFGSNMSYASYVNNLAGLYLGQGRFGDAETLFRQALEIDAETVGTAHPTYGITLNNLAGAIQQQGRFHEAEKLFLLALEVGAKTIGTAHPYYAARLSNLADSVQAQGRFAEAETLYRQSLAIHRDKLGDVDSRIGALAANFLTFLETHNPNAPDIPALRALLGK